MKVLAPTPYLKSSQSPLQRHHALRRDSGAELPHPRLPRPTASPTALHSRSARATRPIPGASWARASTGCWRSTKTPCWRCGAGRLGARLGQRSDADTAVPDAPRRELHRQRCHPRAELGAGVGGRGASLRQWDHAARQVRRRICLALIDLRRHGHASLQVVRALRRRSASTSRRPYSRAPMR